MSLKKWAVKPGELRALDAAGLLLFGARCALRVEPWLARSSRPSFAGALEIVLEAAHGARVRADTVKRALGDSGAIACNALDGTKDEALGRCMNYATQSLVVTLDAAEESDVAARKKTIIEAAKLAASIPALLAHAGLIRAKAGEDAVTQSATTIWNATRSDIAAVQSRPKGKLSAAELRALAPLWPNGVPAWVPRAR